MLTNTEIANAFELCGKLMELHGENTFKARSYINAAFQIGKLNKELSEMNVDEISSIPGVGVAIQEKILALLDTGTFPLLEELLKKTPKGILQIMHIKGLGPKKVAVIWKELGVENIGELEYACRENRLSLLKGFGAKTQQSVLEKIEFMKRSAGKVHYATLEKEILNLEKSLKACFPNTLLSVSGAFRRRDTVIDCVEFVIAATVDSLLAQLPSSFNATKKDDNNIQLSYLPIPVIIHACAAEQFEYTLFRTTGTTEFLKSFSSIDIATAISEKEIFEKSGKPYLIPEMRNGKHEWEWSAKFSNENIIDVSDIKGIIHTHTRWSDGTNSIEEMAKHCMQMGMEYLFISDHSVSAFYANGLSVERIAQQHQEIESLNKSLAPFKIFKSIECDILYDGTLDYADEVLAGFDAVIISVHSMLNMDIDKATNRLLKAIAHPYTSILGHPSGRLLLSRAGYPLHYEKIIDACAANDVVIELNANPWRLDIDWEWIYYAMNKGVKISINPDAHSIEGIHDIHYGVLAARKGGLTKAFLFNSLTLSEMEAYLLNRKTKIIR